MSGTVPVSGAERPAGRDPPESNTRPDNPGATAAGVRVTVRELAGLRAEARRLLPGRAGRITDLFPGASRALLRGRGLEFDEVRAYQAGDDYRSLDWRVSARTGRLHTKLFQEEREHSLHIVLDAGAGMHFGTRNRYKWVSAAHTAALFAWLAVDGGDRVGALIYGSGEGLQVVRPGGGQAATLRLFQRLASVSVPPAGATAPAARDNDLAAALARLEQAIRPGSSILVLSDFLPPDTEAERRLLHLAGHHETLAILCHDPLERELPPPGRYAVSDGLQRLVLDSGDASLRQAHREAFARRLEALTALCRRSRLRFFALGTEQDLLEGLRAGLHAPAVQRTTG